MIKIGDLFTEGGGASIYKIEDHYIVRFRRSSLALELDEHERMEYEKLQAEENSKRENIKYPSLDAVRAAYRGYAFRAEGSSDFDVDEVRKLLAGSGDRLNSLRAIYPEQPGNDVDSRAS